MNYSIIIVAAGSGSRMNLGYNKVYYKLENGLTVLEETINKFIDDKRCTQIIVVCDIQDFCNHIKMHNSKILLAKGGDSRQKSVYNGLLACINDFVLIHDGARPYVSKKIIENVLQAMKYNDACCVMVPVKDTIKVVKNNTVIETIDRSILRQAQTPQAFKTDLIFTCYKKAIKDNFMATDDASLVERYSKSKVVEVEGEYKNIKLTTVDDLA